MVAIVDFNGDEGEIRYLNTVLSMVLRISQDPRYLSQVSKKQPDYEDWLQCHTCGNIYPVYEAKFDSKIKDFVETTVKPN